MSPATRQAPRAFNDRRPCNCARDPSCPQCLGTGQRPVPIVGSGCWRHGTFPTEPTERVEGFPCPECWLEEQPASRCRAIQDRILERGGGQGFRPEDRYSAPDATFALVFPKGVPTVSLPGYVSDPISVPTSTRSIQVSLWPTRWVEPRQAKIEPRGRTNKIGFRFRNWGIALAWVRLP